MRPWGMAARILAVLFLIGLACPAPVHAAGSLHWVRGIKLMADDEALPALDELQAAGILWEVGRQEWPVHVLIRVQKATGEGERGGVEAAVDMYELDLGALWILRRDQEVRPFVGAGLAIVNPQLKIRRRRGLDRSEWDLNNGWFLSGGIFWRPRPRLSLGFEAKAVRDVRMDFDGLADWEADHLEGVFLLGFGWPAFR